MIKFVYQNKPLGTGDAVLKTQKFIKDKFFLMLLPDDLIIKNDMNIAIKKSFLMNSSRVWVHTCSLDHKNALKNYLARGMKIFKSETLNKNS